MNEQPLENRQGFLPSSDNHSWVEAINSIFKPTAFFTNKYEDTSAERTRPISATYILGEQGNQRSLKVSQPISGQRTNFDIEIARSESSNNREVLIGDVKFIATDPDAEIVILEGTFTKGGPEEDKRLDFVAITIDKNGDTAGIKSDKTKISIDFSS